MEKQRVEELGGRNAEVIGTGVGEGSEELQGKDRNSVRRLSCQSFFCEKIEGEVVEFLEKVQRWQGVGATSRLDRVVHAMPVVDALLTASPCVDIFHVDPSHSRDSVARRV